ncbi:MAG: hypothetical protein ACXWJN_00095, partial [Methyloceanibacter sp.]
MAGRPEPARYIVRRANLLPKPSAAWNDPAWSRAETLAIACFHARGTRSRGPPTPTHIPTPGIVLFDVNPKVITAGQSVK